MHGPKLMGYKICILELAHTENVIYYLIYILRARRHCTNNKDCIFTGNKYYIFNNSKYCIITNSKRCIYTDSKYCVLITGILQIKSIV